MKEVLDFAIMECPCTLSAVLPTLFSTGSEIQRNMKKVQMAVSLGQCLLSFFWSISFAWSSASVRLKIFRFFSYDLRQLVIYGLRNVTLLLKSKVEPWKPFLIVYKMSNLRLVRVDSMPLLHLFFWPFFVWLSPTASFFFNHPKIL